LADPAASDPYPVAQTLFLLLKKSSLSCLTALTLTLTLLFCSGVLVLLVLGDKIVHVGLGLSELHLVHALAGVPMQEGLAAEHGGELLADALKHLLNRGGVADEGGGHLEALGGDVADAGLDVVGDPLDEVGRVLALDVHHLLVDLLGGHAAAEHAARSEVAAVPGIGGAHHVLGIEALRSKLRDGQGTVLLRSSGGERSKADHEEVETRVRDKVHGNLAEIAVKLTRETKGAGDAGHASAHQVVQVTVGGGGELEGAEADVVKSLVVEDERLIGVLDDLVDREGSVVRLDDSVGHLGGGAASQ
jgi:hypothetical protein